MIRALALVLVVAFLMFQMGIADPTRVSIVRPVHVLNEGTYVRYMVQVSPHVENRLLILSAVDDSGPIRSTKEQLDGESAPRTRWIEWKYGLPAGEYLVIAVVFSAQKEVARASVQVTVLARF